MISTQPVRIRDQLKRLNSKRKISVSNCCKIKHVHFDPDPCLVLGVEGFDFELETGDSRPKQGPGTPPLGNSLGYMVVISSEGASYYWVT